MCVYQYCTSPRKKNTSVINLRQQTDFESFFFFKDKNVHIKVRHGGRDIFFLPRSICVTALISFGFILVQVLW